VIELGREDLPLAWSVRGIAETNGWQVAGLHDLACEIHAGRGEPLISVMNHGWR
jgi:hypothetical protein